MFTDKSTYVESSTKIYDDVSPFKYRTNLPILESQMFIVRRDDSSPSFPEQMAFRYLSWLLYPLFGCYAVYSLLYVEHKGWYSFVLSMLYGFLLTFGKYIAKVRVLAGAAICKVQHSL